MTAVRASLAVAVLLFVTSGCDLVAVLHATPLPERCMRAQYQLTPTDQQAVTPEGLAQVRTIVENRINATGTAFVAVRAIEPDRLSAAFAASDDGSEIRGLIGQTGQLEFIPIPAEHFDNILEGQPLPPGMPTTPIFRGDEIAAARPGQTQTGLPAVDIELKAEGARLFDEYAAANQGQRFAIVLDGIVQSAPTINAPRFNGQVQISGTFTAAEVNQLVTVLRFGALPLPIREVGFEEILCANAGL